MKKLPDNQAKLNRIARNKIRGEQRKAVSDAYKLKHGVPMPVSEERKAQMRAYNQAKRIASGKIAKPKPIKLKPITPAIMPRKKPAPKKESQVKQDNKKQPFQVKMLNNSIEGKIKVVIKKGFDVYVLPGTDIEQVRAKYLNR